MSARRLDAYGYGVGCEVVLLGHLPALEFVEDDGAVTVYGALDWRREVGPSWAYDEDGDLRAYDGYGDLSGPVVPVTKPRDPSKRRQIARRWVRDSRDS